LIFFFFTHGYLGWALQEQSLQFNVCLSIAHL
jgi:hypothetical protein